MKLFVAFVAIVAVAAAGPFKPAGTAEGELEAIIAAIQHPSTNPATAALLEQQLQDLIASVVPPVDAAPIIVAPSPSPIVYPTPIVEPVNPNPGPIVYPTPIVEPIVPGPINPSPIVVPSPIEAPATTSSALVQIIVNVNNAADGAAPAPSPVVLPSPIQIVDEAIDNNPIQPTPIQIVDVAVDNNIQPTPIQVVDAAPVPAEPILIAEPIVPLPVINIPDAAN